MHVYDHAIAGILNWIFSKTGQDYNEKHRLLQQKGNLNENKIKRGKKTSYWDDLKTQTKAGNWMAAADYAEE